MIAGVVDFAADACTPELRARALKLVAGSADPRPPQTAGAVLFATCCAQARRGSARLFNEGASAGLLVVADLRLDGRAALLSALGLDAEVDDASLIHAGWCRWGADCVDHLFGDFAFAVWDRSNRALWLARDALGQRPLFVLRSGSQLAFSSALGPLRQLHENADADPIAIADHLLNLPGDPERSAWRAIARVPAGHIGRFAGRGLPALRRYFVLAPPPFSDELSESEWRAGWRERFTAAVSNRLSADTPIAATLSGGLDSSAVAAMAAHLRPDRPVIAYAGRFPQTLACDEGRYVDELRTLAGLPRAGLPRARLPRAGLEVRDLDVSASSPLAEFAELLPTLDEPLLIQNLHLWTTIYRAAQADGLRSVLDGHDGDSALGRSAGGDLALRPTRPTLPTRLLDQLRGLGQRLRSTPPALHVIDLLNPDFARASQARERLACALADRRQALLRAPSDRHVWRLNNGYPAYATERLSIIAAHFGIDARHPFYAVDLLRWSVGLPAALKERDGYSRWVLRDALAGVLPETLRWRADKTSLSTQFHRAFGSLDAALLDAVLGPSDSRLAEYVDLKKVRQLVRDYRHQPSNQASTPLWAIATLGLWLQRG